MKLLYTIVFTLILFYYFISSVILVRVYSQTHQYIVREKQHKFIRSFSFSIPCLVYLYVVHLSNLNVPQVVINNKKVENPRSINFRDNTVYTYCRIGLISARAGLYVFLCHFLHCVNEIIFYRYQGFKL